MILCATFVVYVRNIESLDIDLCLSLQLQGSLTPDTHQVHYLVCSSGKEALKHSKEYCVSGCLKQDNVPGDGFFRTLDLKKAFSFRGLCPLTPTWGVTPGPHQGPSVAPGSHFKTFDFSTIPNADNVIFFFFAMGCVQCVTFIIHLFTENYRN